MLEIDSLSYHISNTILFNQISLTISEGECYLIQGKSGEGKTTLCEIISGNHSGYSGNLTFWGHNLMKKKEIRHLIHYLKQKPEENFLGLSPFKDLKLWHYEKKTISTQISSVFDPLYQMTDPMDVLTLLGLSSKSDSMIWKLSFGEMKLMSFAALLLYPRPFWILDEPFAGLDQKKSQIVLEIMSRHVHSQGSILMTGHTVKETDLLEIKRLKLLKGEILCAEK